MNSSRKIIQELQDSIDWIELALIILNSGVGLALTHQLLYPINWILSLLFILWTIFFFLGSEFLNIYSTHDYLENEINKYELAGTIKLLTVLFFSVSIIPLIQIILVSLNNYLPIYLISLLALWFLMRKILEVKIRVFGITETVLSFMFSFIIPIIVLNINNIQIHELLIPIAFFIFLEIIAFKFIGEFIFMIQENTNSRLIPLYIGFFTLQRTIIFLISFGYSVCFIWLFSQGRMQLLKTLLVTLPLAFLIINKVQRANESERGDMKRLKETAIIFITLVEVSWIISLWVS
jgi:hypothetical protein